MIRTITRREYLIACDGCGQASPAAATVNQASQLARHQGWQSCTPVRGLDFLTTWLCPTCQRHRAAAGHTAAE